MTAFLRTHGVRQRDTVVDGNRIHYLEALPAAGSPERTLVLVHGLGARASDWAPMIPQLAAHGYHVYALDLLGYGDSVKPANGDFSIRGEERVVTDFMQQLGIAKADVAGWSMGGWVAMKVALDHPERVNRLLLYDSAGLYYRINFPVTLFTPDDKAGLYQLMSYLEPDKPRIQLPAFAVPGTLRKFREKRWVVDKSLASMLAGRDVLDFRVAQLQMPVLIVWGTEDKLIPFSSGERLHELVPQSVLVGIDGCGHLLPSECAKQALPPTLRFLDANPPLPPSRSILPADR